jgi:hypothetical protein
MKLRLNHHFVIALSTLVLHQTNLCMNTLVCLALVNTKSTVECGKVRINVTSLDTEATITEKILQARHEQEINAPVLTTILKITLANRLRTPLAQLISEGFDLHKHLVLRALLQAK